MDVDREYREKAEADELPKIAPRRFNPAGEKWLPILHTERDDRHYTVLFSNTARAHELGKTNDWVVLYFGDGSGEQQVTVVTGTSGPLKGKRVVRGVKRSAGGTMGSERRAAWCGEVEWEADDLKQLGELVLERCEDNACNEQPENCSLLPPRRCESDPFACCATCTGSRFSPETSRRPSPLLPDRPGPS